MLTGKQFRLRRAILALDVIDGKKTAMTIPCDAVVRVISGPLRADRRMIDVMWLDRHLAIFAVDLKERGDELRDSMMGAGAA